MYVINPYILNKENLFYCDEENMKDYLIENGFIYISKECKEDKIIWIFSKTSKLTDALKEVS